jgi:2,3-bisphosphoglycerate-dependent phosphoglycerate mutase
MEILLVRHGESLGNVDPQVHATTADHAVPLSDRGREQAREAGRRLAAYFEQRAGGEPAAGGEARAAPGHVRLWVSPYLRTRQTADALQETAGAWITDRVEHVLLCEQQFGLFDGVPEHELPERFPREFAHYDMQRRFGGKFWARMPQGESWFDVAQRIHQAFGTFQRDAQAHGIRDLVVVGHGVTLRAFVMMWCHRPPEWFEQEPNPRNAAIRLIDRGVDRGYVFEGFARR